MTKEKKYSARVFEHESLWSAEIIRRVSRKKTLISKQVAGLASEQEANSWVEQQLPLFIQGQGERNKRAAT